MGALAVLMAGIIVGEIAAVKILINAKVIVTVIYLNNLSCGCDHVIN